MVWWIEDLLKYVIPAAVLGSAGWLTALKPMVGRPAKQADLVDRLTKEVALREAILSLKIAASEPRRARQLEAKELAYRQAEDIEKQFKEKLEALGPDVKPDVLWLRKSTFRERFFPRRYDRQTSLTKWQKWKWWGYYFGFWFNFLVCLSMVALIAIGTGALLSPVKQKAPAQQTQKKQSPGKQQKPSIEIEIFRTAILPDILAVLFAWYFGWISWTVRRAAYSLARETKALTAGDSHGA